MTDTDVLIVDVDPNVRSQLSEVLALRGCRVRLASNGAEALRILESFEPSLVLMDMQTPMMDGWEFARELQSRQIRLPLVVMGQADHIEAWAKEIGAAGFLPKPVEVTRLLACVQIPEHDGSAYAARPGRESFPRRSSTLG